MSEYQIKRNLSKGERMQIQRLSSPRTRQKYSEEKKTSVYEDKPTPLNFDDFVPWVCLEWQVGERVVVIRKFQEEYVSISNRQKKVSIKLKEIVHKQNEETVSNETEIRNPSSTFETLSSEACIPITAFYDNRKCLTEIYIIDCKYQIHQKVIKAINLCLPFHQALRRLAIKNGGLSCNLLHEISEMLPHSNLTDVILDESHVAEGNYYVLLDHISHLKYLSLSKCRINDLVCQEITTRLEAGKNASNTLKVLDLSSNFITDRGAKCIGSALKSNRSLLHLNLAGNSIRDEGAFFIFSYLMEFVICHEDLLQRNRRRMVFAKKKLSIENNDSAENELTASSISNKKRGLFTKNHISRSKIITGNVYEPIEQFTGHFKDAYESKNLTKRDDLFYCIGNMTLCSLNLAYNDLEYPSVRKVITVLKYQNQWAEHFGYSGLLRIILDGNSLPIKSIDYDIINTYLNKAINAQMPVTKKRDAGNKRDGIGGREESLKNNTSINGEKPSGKKKTKKHKKSEIVRK